MLVDANILIDALEDEPIWSDWAIAQLKEQSFRHQLFVNSIIYAEVSLAYPTPEELDDALNTLGITLLEIPRQAAFLAGRAFAEYRKSGGTKTNVLSDFFIGAHAQVTGMPILTRDVRRYRRYFSDVVLVSPSVQ